MLNSLQCPLCGATNPTIFHQDTQRSYRQCQDCALVFVPEHERVSPSAEKAYYDLHENDPADPGYRRFLSRLVEPLLQRLAPGANGLDFGCGPGPALADMLSEAGMCMSLYDAFYTPNTAVLQRSYDFITCSEVLEHLHQPYLELQRLFAILKPGGWLGIMTKRVRNRAAFAHWHYIRDPTHVCFYSKTTLYWIAERWQVNLELPADDVTLFQK